MYKVMRVTKLQCIVHLFLLRWIKGELLAWELTALAKATVT